jgi:dCTP deaminase
MDSARASFWSGETLNERLHPLIKPFSEQRIDCAAYTLAMGREVYVSPSDQAVDPNSVSIRKLEDGEAFTIPPGQLAFLLTEEIIEVPADAIAFISMRSKIKWRGLVNVSGFHVDPGFHGRLIFTVFNAGPVPVHLRQGQPAFLIWYAGLDRQSKLIKRGNIQESIPAELINSVAGELQSFAGLSKKMKDVEKSLTDRVHGIEREQTYYRLIAILMVGFIGAMIATWVKDGGLSRLFTAAPLSSSSTPGTPLQTSSPPPSAVPR